MLKVYNCIATAHDIRLVGLAVVICGLASFTAVSLLRYAASTKDQMRYIWIGVAAIAGGFGIWATHFIAMLAFTPGVPNGYNIFLTIISLLAAVLLCGAGLATALNKAGRAMPWIGGAIVGGGIAAMHYIGMAAFEIQGIVLWDLPMVVVSIVLGGLIGAAALPAGLKRPVRWRYYGTVLLTLAIASHHFTAMAAASILPDPTLDIPSSALPTGLLAVGVALVSATIIFLALAGVSLDLKERKRSQLEAGRLQGLADAAVEGLVVCDGGAIVTINKSFAALMGIDAARAMPKQVADCFPDLTERLASASSPEAPLETCLRQHDGRTIPVEVLHRAMDYRGRPHQVIAVRDLRARKEAERHIRYLAHHDPLTTLPNRSYFNNKLDQAIVQANATGRKLAVLCLDLDRFKEVNDLFGHAAGDRVLQIVATQTSTLLEDNCMMARLGGDEFAILLPEISHASAAGRLAETILTSLQLVDEGSRIERISCSIGIAVYPDDAVLRETLLGHADTALYRAKTDGRGTYRFFEARMGAEVRARRELEHDLRLAIPREEFSLAFQPQTDIQTNEVTGFEALLRWQHPVRGTISPATFIPIAEETGAILDIGLWVLRESCREAAKWRNPLSIAVNVSVVQLHNTTFVQAVHQILLETGLAAHRLELEITETALVRDLNRALTTLRQLKALGVRIAMDDFGTGYSSLSNLRAFPFDKIKIDSSFVRSVDANASAATIVRAVLGLGRGLGLPVLAEGVETSEELHFLRDEGCGAVQGYLLGRPSSIAAFHDVIHDDASVVPAGNAERKPPATMVA
jgi:diguanylate cyclase (GGDEF)-like protein/PAS domain S-box-containing protein